MHSEKLKSNDPRKLAGLLLEMLQFQHIWTLYYASGHRLHYREELFELRSALIRHFGELFVLDQDRKPPEGKALNLHSISDLTAILEAWERLSGPLPLKDGLLSCYWVEMFAWHVMALRNFLDIPQDFFKSASAGPGPFYLAESWQALRYHLPRDLNIALIERPEDVAARISSGRCIVMFGDIRNSQDLLYNTQPPEQYFHRLMGFTSHVRNLAIEHGGIFDKFTGDGFLVLFSEEFSRTLTGTRDNVWSFLDFTYDVLAFAKQQFGEWEKVVSKVPKGGYGLCLGADFGTVKADIAQSELRVVGLPLVWASRFCSAGKPGELLANAQLKELLSGVPGVNHEEVSCKTKHGDSIKGWRVSLSFPEDHGELLHYARSRYASSVKVRDMFEDRKARSRSWEPFLAEEKALFEAMHRNGDDAETIAKALNRVTREIRLYWGIGPDHIAVGGLRKRLQT